MVEILTQLFNGLDKGAAYALIALGLTLIFGTLGVVNFAHGAIFMIGAFVAVGTRSLLSLESVSLSETELNMFGQPAEIKVPYVNLIFGDGIAAFLTDWTMLVALLVAIPIMLFLGFLMERGLVRFFYKRPHADQILVTFGLAIILGELVRTGFGASEIPVVPMPSAFPPNVDLGAMFGLEQPIIYFTWRIVYFIFALIVIAGVFAFLQFTTFGMVVRAGMADRETVGLLGIDIDKRFTTVFAIAVMVAGVAGVMYAPVKAPTFNLGMEFLVISFVVVVVGGMGSLPGAVLAGFVLGILEAFASMPQVIEALPGINQIIIYLIAIVVLLVRPRGLMGRKGVMET